MKYARLFAAGSMVAAVFASASCKPKPHGQGSPTASATPTPAKAPAPTGLLDRLPADTDLYFSVHELGPTLRKFFASKFAAELKANPLWADLPAIKGGDLTVEGLSATLAKGDPERAKRIEAARILMGREFFVAMPAGSATLIADLLELNEAYRFGSLAASVQLGLAAAGKGGEKLDPKAADRQALAALAPKLEALLVSAKLPRFIAGFRAGPGSEQAAAALDEFERRIPSSAQKQEWAVPGGSNGVRYKVQMSGALTPEAKAGLVKALGTVLTGPEGTAAAQRLADRVAALEFEVGRVQIGDHILVALGPDLSHAALAPAADRSLASLPDIAKVRALAGDRLFMLAYNSKAFTEAFVPRTRMAEMVAQLEPALVQFLPTEELTKLQADARRLDAEAAAFMGGKADAAAAASYWENGLRSEQIGGMIPAASGSPQRPTIPLPASAFLHFYNSGNPAATKGFFDWLADLGQTIHGTTMRTLQKRMPPEQLQQVSAIEQLAVPKIAELHGAAKQFALDGIGAQGAFLLELDAPPSGGQGPVTAQLLKAFRAAFVADLKDPAAVASAWDRTMKVANDAITLMPPNPAIPVPLPTPARRDVNGAAIHVLPLPPQLLPDPPAVAIKSGRWILASQSEYAAKLAGEPAPGDASPLLSSFRLQVAPACDLAAQWVEKHAGQKAGQDAAAKRRLEGVQGMLRSLRAIESADYRAWLENDRLRASSQITFRER